ncbi:MAG: glucose-1-phosphate adenylyltransferase subunit GlgD [Clostridia bacterium]|nr:glucose-1-phosphate adenylyltransferase subunit GlgD [Clostridia bacterium]
MIISNTLGIVFANAHDALLKDMTKTSSMGAVNYGGRYRLIDFALSNLSNGGVSKVGVITKSNYYSLMAHIGNGKPWDLDRKKGGINILPPYISPEAQVYKGRLEAIHGILEYLEESKEENVVICDSDVVANINIRNLLAYHKEKNADITVVTAYGKKPNGQKDMMHYDFGEDGRIISVDFSPAEDCEYSLDTMVIGRELLIDIVKAEFATQGVSLSHGIFEKGLNKYRIYGYKHQGYSAVIDSIESYFNANLDLLSKEVRNDVFNKNNPIYTNSRDDMPAKYGLKSKVKNAIIADGCIIEGTVKNSVLFRGVKVGAGAVVENCVLMHGAEIGAGAKVSNVIADNFVKISDNKEVGAQTGVVYIEKNTLIGG